MSDGNGPVPLAGLVERLMYENFEYFVGRLLDSGGRPLLFEAHHRRWAALILDAPRVVLMAPRDHGKSIFILLYLAWRCWRHGRDPATGRRLAGPTGSFTAVLFSATWAQPNVLASLFRDLLSANEDLFGMPAIGSQSTSRRRRMAWSRTQVRLANGAELHVRAFQTSVRGLHPDLLLLDDVLSDANSITSDQRRRTWNYFVGTILSMNPDQLILVGTAFHRDDLLHRLQPSANHAGFVWAKYKALDLETNTALWPARHPVEELLALREFDSTSFSQEYQNDPRDDAASMFPSTLTDPLLRPDLTFLPSYQPSAEEVVVFGMDIAISAEVGADFTVLWIASLNRVNQHRRMLMGYRLKGLGFREQVELIRTVCRSYGVSLGLVEENGFQRWLQQELLRFPETAHVVLGHRTGSEKANLDDGIPAMKIVMQNGLWGWPTGGSACFS